MYLKVSISIMNKLFSVFKMRYFLCLALLTKPIQSFAFACITYSPPSGWFGDGVRDVYVNINPSMQSGGNIIVDLEPIITCKHEGGVKLKTTFGSNILYWDRNSRATMLRLYIFLIQ